METIPNYTNALEIAYEFLVKEDDLEICLFSIYILEQKIISDYNSTLSFVDQLFKNQVEVAFYFQGQVQVGNTFRHQELGLDTRTQQYRLGYRPHTGHQLTDRIFLPEQGRGASEDA